MKTEQWVDVLSRRNGYSIFPLRGLLTPETFSPVKPLRHRVMRCTVTSAAHAKGGRIGGTKREDKGPGVFL
jgi:hypothetical protein